MDDLRIGPASIALGDEGRLLKQRARRTRWLVCAIAPILAVSAPLIMTRWVLALLEMLGVLCLIACIVGRTWSAVYIGERKGRELVQVGPYSVMRNPLYLSSFVGTVGAALLSGMITLLVLAVIAFAAYYRATIAREEEYLRERHGPAYDAYARIVPRWWPNLSTWRDVPRVGTSPSLVLKHLRESSFFFFSFFFFEGVRLLHDAGIVPVLIRLP